MLTKLMESSAMVYHAGVMYGVSIETFDVDRASDALKLNTTNRPLSRSKCRQLASALTRGEWKLNGETVVFGTDGKLIQGQHRMDAVVRSGVPITTFVVRGVPNNVFNTFDNTKARNGSDTLAIDGHKSVHNLAAAARAILRITEGAGEVALHCSPARLQEIVKAHPTLVMWVQRHTGSVRTFMPSYYIGIATVAAERHGHEVIAKFTDAVASGELLTRESPAFLLRDKFINRSRGQVIQAETGMAYIIKAMNAHLTGKPMKMLVYRPDEAFPTLL